MRGVLYALALPLVASIYFFGWRSLAIVVFCCLVAYFTEVIFESYRNGTPTESILVSGALYGLSMPPLVPFWIAAVGMIVGVVFGKQVFGGFARNVFNPAIVGRCFVYVSFPIQMTTQWLSPGAWPWGRLASYADLDAVTSATPLAEFRQNSVLTDVFDLFWGNIPGSLGETCAPAIVIGGLYLIVRKYADWRYPVSCFLGAVGLNSVLYLMGLHGVMDPLRNILAGSFLFGAFFMVTEPVSGCARPMAKWAYGLLIGCLWIVIRTFSGFPEATSFAILLGNTFGPLLDQGSVFLEQRKRPLKPA